jgi:superfamily II DNA helicase RecQ
MSSLVPKVTRELKIMRRTLRDVFGLEQLRPGQAEVIRSVLEGVNTRPLIFAREAYLCRMEGII